MIIEAVKGRQTKKLDFTPGGLSMDDLITAKEEQVPEPEITVTPRDWANKPESKRPQYRQNPAHQNLV